MAELNTIITLRQGTTADWSSSTVVLKTGEMGLEYLADGAVKIKAGDGEHLWGDLSYIGSDVKSANVFQVELGDEVDDIAAIEAQVALEGAEKQDGDVAIVKSTFADGKISYTSYVYDSALDIEGENSSKGWNAMDGNYSASNVFLKNEITLAGDFESVGNMSKGDTVAAGTSLEKLFSDILQQELYPTNSDIPNASISANGGSGEVGSSYTLPTATLKIDDVGSYEYGPATGITFAVKAVKLAQGADPATATNYKENEGVMVSGSTLKLQAVDDNATLYADSSKSYTFSASATYGDGAIPVTNLGNEYASAQIKGADLTIADKTVTFSGYRKAFAGGTTAAALDSATIRAASATKTGFSSMDAQSEALEFTAAAGATKVFFAYPSTWSVGSKKPYFEMFGLAWAENTDIVAKDDVQVADARGTNEDGTLNGAVAYKVYCWELDTPLQAESTKFRVWFK